MSTRSANRAATALGVAAALFAAVAGLLLMVRQEALPPRWDVLGAAAAALLCLAARALAGRPAPAPPVGTPMPGLPAVLPAPRRAWQPLRQLVAGWLVLGCGYALLTLPSVQTYDRIGGLLRADARVTAGRIESAEHVEAVSWSYRKERPGSNRKVRDRPLQYRSDLVLTVLRPGGDVRIAVPGASTEDVPQPGRTVRVLAAADHPELGGYLAADSDLNAYRSGVSAAGALGPAALVAVVLLVLVPVRRARRRLTDEHVRALRQAADRVAVRVTRSGTTELGGLRFTTDGAGTTAIEVLPEPGEPPAGPKGWLIGPKEHREKVRPVVFAADDGTLLWGTAHRPFPRQAAPVDPDRRLHRATVPLADLGVAAVGAAGLALVAPLLLHGADQVTGYRVAGALALTACAVALRTLLHRRALHAPHGSGRP